MMIKIATFVVSHEWSNFWRTNLVHLRLSQNEGFSDGTIAQLDQFAMTTNL